MTIIFFLMLRNLKLIEIYFAWIYRFYKYCLELKCQQNFSFAWIGSPKWTLVYSNCYFVVVALTGNRHGFHSSWGKSSHNRLSNIPSLINKTSTICLGKGCCALPLIPFAFWLIQHLDCNNLQQNYVIFIWKYEGAFIFLF